MIRAILQMLRSMKHDCRCSGKESEYREVVPQVKEKPKLSAEEARKQAEEVLRKAKEKREVRRSAPVPASQDLDQYS